MTALSMRVIDRAQPRIHAPEQVHVADVHRSQRNSDQRGNK
jgi:hypothetical protein